MSYSFPPVTNATLPLPSSGTQNPNKPPLEAPPVSQVSRPIVFPLPQQTYHAASAASSLKSKKDRIKFLHADNQTPSVGGYRNHHLTSENFLWVLSSWINFYSAFESSLQLAMQRRVACMAQQLFLASHTTNLIFQRGKTRHQAESAESLVYIDASNINNKSVPIPLNASHTCTVPCLVVFHLNNDYPSGFVFALGSDCYKFWNSTIELPDFVNKMIDRAIDEMSGLRTKCLEMLNRVARGNSTPEAEVQAYVAIMLETIKSLKSIIPQRVDLNDDQKRIYVYIYQTYENEMEVIRHELMTNPQALQRYLHIQLSPLDQQNPLFRYTLTQLRVQAVLHNYLKQAELCLRMETVRDEILSHYKRKPPLADRAFKELIANLMPTQEDRARVRKLLNLHPIENENSYRLGKIKSTYHILFNAAGQTIQNLAHEISRSMDTMRNQEVANRGHVLRWVRELRGWSHDDVAKRLRSHLKPGEEVDTSAICEIENGQRILYSYLFEVSKALEIDQTFLEPQFFNQ